MVGICTLEDKMGMKPDPACIEELEAHALYEPSAGLIRMVASVWQGDMPEADRWKRHVELLQIQTTSRQVNDGTHLISEVVAYAFLEDLTRVKRTIDAVEAMANEYPGWIPVLHYASGEYHRIRGDYQSALVELDKRVGGLIWRAAGEMVDLAHSVQPLDGRHGDGLARIVLAPGGLELAARQAGFFPFRVLYPPPSRLGFQA